jgi:glyoxylase-like metal-dependent hydrolase (beta-lactamase superfamily II)
VYLDSLRRVQALRPTRLLPGHGPIVEDPQALIEQYLRHRAERDAQILDAVRRGFASPAAIVPEVYGRVPDVIVKAANDSVLAHLVKLEREGKVTRAASPGEDPATDPHVAPLWASRRE